MCSLHLNLCQIKENRMPFAEGVEKEMDDVLWAKYTQRPKRN